MWGGLDSHSHTVWVSCVPALLAKISTSFSVFLLFLISVFSFLLEKLKNMLVLSVILIPRAAVPICLFVCYHRHFQCVVSGTRTEHILKRKILDFERIKNSGKDKDKGFGFIVKAPGAETVAVADLTFGQICEYCIRK